MEVGALHSGGSLAPLSKVLVPAMQATNFFLELLPRSGRGSFGIRTHLHSQRRPRGRRRCCGHWLSLQAGCRCRPPQWPWGGRRLRRRRRRPTCSCCLGSDAGWFPKNKGHPDDLMLPNMAGKATASMAKQDRHRRRRMRSRSGH